jgi:hypothetical protein
LTLAHDCKENVSFLNRIFHNRLQPTAFKHVLSIREKSLFFILSQCDFTRVSFPHEKSHQKVIGRLIFIPVYEKRVTRLNLISILFYLSCRLKCLSRELKIKINIILGAKVSLWCACWSAEYHVQIMCFFASSFISPVFTYCKVLKNLKKYVFWILF